MKLYSDKIRWHAAIIIILLLFLHGSLFADTAVKDSSVVATVGDKEITALQLKSALHAEMRRKFYHGSVSVERKDALRKEVLADMVDKALLLKEASRRGLKADASWVDRELQKWRKRIDERGWQSQRDVWLKSIALELEEKSLVEKVKAEIKNSVVASDKDIRDYYESYPDKFTTPEQFHVLLILLKVDPSSASDVWEAAFSKAEDLASKIRSGGDFAEFARRYSGHESASEGGDLGYIHKGMLASQAQNVLDELKPGDISDPVVLLQGVAIMKLVDRRPPLLNKFADVKKRAGELWLRDNQEHVLHEFIGRLRDTERITVNESVLANIE